MELDSDLKARDARIEHLREQQSATENSKQFQNFQVEINTQKGEKTRLEDSAVAKLADVEELQKLEATQRQAVKEEQTKAEQLQQSIGGKTKELEGHIQELEPRRDTAAEKVPAQSVAMFDRLADNYDGEALAAVGHIEGKTEGYYCTGCNMELVVDVYNRLDDAGRDHELPRLRPNPLRAGGADAGDGGAAEEDGQEGRASEEEGPGRQAAEKGAKGREVEENRLRRHPPNHHDRRRRVVAGGRVERVDADRGRGVRGRRFGGHVQGRGVGGPSAGC